MLQLANLFEQVEAERVCVEHALLEHADVLASFFMLLLLLDPLVMPLAHLLVEQGVLSLQHFASHLAEFELLAEALNLVSLVVVS